MLSRLIILILLAASLPAWAAKAGDYPVLWDRMDSALLQRLTTTLINLGHAKAIKNKKLAVVLVDITQLDKPRVAAINGDYMIYAASIPKLAILLGAFIEISAGRMRLDDETRDSLTRMIRVSSNRDATRMLDRIGKEHLLEILQSKRILLYDPQHSGGLWVGKAYGKSPAYKRDPLSNLSHGATAMQVARFYYLLETGQLVDKALSAQMKAMLGDPGINHKFVKGLENYPEVKIFRKSGSWKRWHGDSALIEAGDYKYIVVALAEDARGGAWLSRMIRPIHKLIVSE